MTSGLVIIELASRMLAAVQTVAPAQPSLRLPDWIQLTAAIVDILQGGATVVIAVALVVLTAKASAWLRRKPADNAAFVAELLSGLGESKKVLGHDFLDRLRVPSLAGPVNARAYVTELSRLLRQPLAFIADMRARHDWPSDKLRAAFRAWAAAVEGIDTKVTGMADGQDSIAIGGMWGALHEQYIRDEFHLRADVSALADLARAVEKAAKPFKKKDDHGADHGDEGHEEHDHH